MIKPDGIPIHVLPDKPFMAAEQSLAFGDTRLSHRIDFFAVIWFLEDSGEHLIDFEPYPVKKNMVYLISRNQVHAIPSGILPHARIIVFSTEFFHRIEEPQIRQLFHPFDNKGIILPKDMVRPLMSLFALILLEYQTQAETDLLLKYTTALLLQLYRFSRHRIAAAGEDFRMVKLFQLMEENFRDNRSASFYSGSIGLTPKRVNEILREKVGFTMSQLLYQLVLIEAKRELFHGEFSIKEIAYRLGFADQSYFARFFKKHTGNSPEKFRESTDQKFSLS